MRNIVLLVLMLISKLIMAQEKEMEPKLNSIPEEFKVKREEIFEFVQKPKITKESNQFTISFETKGFCDATIAIENADGKIVRHLVSGVLGPKAPAPFQINSKIQKVIWDGKDDQGNYVKGEELSGCKIRVSLGLKPQFEKTLYWSPKKRMGNNGGAAVIKAIKEGVLVADGKGVDRLTLYDHEGEYVRMIYPFPNKQIKKVNGLEWNSVPQGGEYPMKHSLLLQTLLTSGNNSKDSEKVNAMSSNGISSIAVNGNRIALSRNKLNRLLLDGSTGGLNLEGPATSQFQATNSNIAYGGPIFDVLPSSSAFSPDGKWVYLSGYIHHIGDTRGRAEINCLHGVVKVPYEGEGKLEVFLGKITPVTGLGNNMKDAGSDDNSFTCATSVACDSIGRIYVSDFMNNRIQVFAPDKKLLKSIETPFPAKVQIHPVTDEIYVLSYIVMNPKFNEQMHNDFKSTLTQFGTFENPVKKLSYPLPILNLPNGMGYGVGTKESPYSIEIDFWSTTMRLWVSTAIVGRNNDANWDQANIKIFELANKQFNEINFFGKIVEKQIGRKKMPNVFSQVQYPYVNPLTGLLYIAEPTRNQNFDELIEINPNTNELKIIKLPFTTTDLAFDYQNNIYLRSRDVVVRYDFKTWKEVPWDYGEELSSFPVEAYGRSTSVISGLRLPSIDTNQTHQGGMSISGKGNLIVSCVNSALHIRGEIWNRVKEAKKVESKEFTIQLYAGKLASESLHIWDKHGKILFKDVVQGLGRTDGVWLDNENQIYAMSVGHRITNGKRYYNNRSETVMKFMPNKARFQSNSENEGFVPVILPKSEIPKISPDLHGIGDIWAEGAEWFYGGAGFAGKIDGGGCCCWHANFVIDGYARSIAPIVDQYRVDIVDTSGNLIYKMGQYGNVDDGLPLDKIEGPKNPQSIGSDEVALFHACYVATDSDKRIFIVDIGNGRVVCVKVGYQQSEIVELKNK